MSSVFLIKVACIVIIQYVILYVLKKFNINAGRYMLFVIGIFAFIFILAVLSS